MEDADKMPQCPVKVEKPPKCVYDKSLGFQRFKIENMTVTRAPLVKSYYWQFFGIEKLNEKLDSDLMRFEHSLGHFTRHLNTKPLKIILWIRSMNEHLIVLDVKRIQNCECVPLETQVGFNQFRMLYHCPHRRLINISQEHYEIKPNELVAMTIVFHFYIYGTYILSFEITCSDGRTIIFNFEINIVTIDPIRCILTKKLVPVSVTEPRRMSQAIWVRNITMQNIKFRFMARNRGLRLINPNLVVPRQSVWPLIVEYRPSDFKNELDLILIYNGCRYNVPITCKGILEEEYIEEPYTIPIFDYMCADYLYVIYPNKLDFVLELNEDRTLLLAIHNHNQICMEFKWQTYSINGYFTITFDPLKFKLKGHHSKLIMVHCRSFDKPLTFTCIPAVLEIHRILDKSTEIAHNLLTEIESIDDPKWHQDSYSEHLLLHVNVKVKFPVVEPVTICYECACIPQPLIVPVQKYYSESSKLETLTIFEKLFWEYLSRSTFLRSNSKVPKNLTYEEVIERTSTNGNTSKEKLQELNTMAILSFIANLMAESCRDVSKNYRFVPAEILNSP